VVVILQRDINSFIFVVLAAANFDDWDECSPNKFGLAHEVQCLDDIIDFLQQIDSWTIVSSCRNYNHIDVRLF